MTQSTRTRLWALVIALVVAGCAPATPAATPPGQPTIPTAAPSPTSPIAPTAIPPPMTAVTVPTTEPTATTDPPTPAPTPTLNPTPRPTEALRPNGPPHDPGPLDWAKPGPYVAPGYTDFRIDSFGAKQPVATTYYFYWHDLTDPARIERSRQYWIQTPINPETYSFLNPATHLSQFQDMQAAGLDFALPVYWGEPGHPGRSFNPTPGHFWSTDGIPPMVEALDQLAAAGHPFKVGMFYDTTILANADLTTPAGKEYFYVNVRDFYSQIPPRYWAAIGGKPIVWLYDTQWVAKYDQSSFDYLSERFAQDFGGLHPYIVREWEWYNSKGVEPAAVIHSDGLYSWGAAPSGYNADSRLTVAEVGPGFSNTRYCKGGPAANCFDVDRQDGAFYERELQAAVRSGRKILAVETWNEFSEGSDIADTIQFGRQYIELTRKYVELLHSRG